MTDYPLLTDAQCKTFLKRMRAFGYPSLTFERVRKLADELYAGKSHPTNVIFIFLKSEVEKMIEISNDKQQN